MNLKYIAAGVVFAGCLAIPALAEPAPAQMAQAASITFDTGRRADPDRREARERGDERRDRGLHRGWRDHDRGMREDRRVEKKVIVRRSNGGVSRTTVRHVED